MRRLLTKEAFSYTFVFLIFPIIIYIINLSLLEFIVIMSLEIFVLYVFRRELINTINHGYIKKDPDYLGD